MKRNFKSKVEKYFDVKFLKTWTTTTPFQEQS